ncbi:MAG: FtsX-like permease family protein [Cyclobacteriaceae bacterium]|nr:FtsX-like permease family protein [Cyclobacteriaceae bacterium]
MFRNYWTIALRSFSRQRNHVVVLFLGLTAGITCFIITFLFFTHETGYDTFHAQADRIFRIQQNRYNKNELTNSSAASNFGIGADMATELPEVERYVMTLKNICIVVKDGEVFKSERSGYATEDFFKVFSIRLLKGNDSLVLARPFTIALSESFSRIIFKDEDPIGKTLSWRGYIDVEVTGIFEDMPAKSHQAFDVLFSMESYRKRANPFVLEEPWRWDGYYNYVMLHRPEQLQSVKEKLPDLIERKTGNWLRETDQKLEINFQPLRSIHLESNFSDEFRPNGNKQTVYFLLIVGLMMLLIAWVNYVSLATVRSIDRAKEVGIRKVVGSLRTQLIGQFLTEAFVINLAAFSIALLTVWMLLPQFSEWFQRDLQLDFRLSPQLVASGLALLAISTLASGLYPAFVISGIAPSQILKGNFSSGKRGQLLRKTMVLIPFTITIVLLISLFALHLQLKLMREKELGFAPAGLFVIQNSTLYDTTQNRRIETFKKEAARIAGVTGLTTLTSLPGEFIIPYANSVQRIGAAKEDVNQYRYFEVDEHFVEILGITLVAGNGFGPAAVPYKDVLVNETASRLLGFSTPDDAVDEKAFFLDDTVMIRGVVRDYHHESPKSKIQPVFYVFHRGRTNYYVIRLESESPETRRQIEQLFINTFPGQAPESFMLMDKYDSQYASDERLGKIITTFTVVLLVITCTGLFSLASFTAKFRMKEIGIRKVMGASASDAAFLLVKEYLIIVLIALAAGIPLALKVLDEWLASFTERIEISWFIVALPALLVLLIALATILWQTMKSARANPVAVLKYE